MKSLLVLGLVLSGSSAFAADIAWPNGKSCVAWKTSKRMFLMKTVEPVGMNCDVKAQDQSAIGANGETHKISISVPIDKFDSGEPSRDKDVTSQLKADVQPNLEYTSQELTATDWERLFKGELREIDGALKIAGKAYPVKMSIVGSKEDDDQVVAGSVDTTYTAFDLKPPVIAGGLVAKVHDSLSLHFRLYGKDVTKTKP